MSYIVPAKTSLTTASTTTPTIAPPSAPSAGSLLIIGVAPGTGGNTWSTITAPTGWTKVPTVGSVTNPTVMFYKVATGSEGTANISSSQTTASATDVGYMEIDAGSGVFSESPTPVNDEYGFSSAASVTTGTIAAQAAIDQVNELAVVCLRVSGTSPGFNNTWTNGFTSVGLTGATGNRINFAIKETTQIETPSTTETWVTAGTHRMAMGTFRMPAAAPSYDETQFLTFFGGSAAL